MAGKEPLEIPVGMRRVCRRFERWRRGHTARLPIPEALWAAAAEAVVTTLLELFEFDNLGSHNPLQTDGLIRDWHAPTPERYRKNR